MPIGAEFSLPGSPMACQVTRFIAQGSQGSVFEVAVEGHEPMALKWYFPESATPRQRAAIEDLIDRGAPAEHFLWPVQLIEVPGVDGFGYMMPLRPASFVKLSELLEGRVDVPPSVTCTLGMHLADSFLALHSQGLCYRDISFGNLFFDPATGRPQICDNDNVGIDGSSESFVLGTRKFMAPEIVRREAGPSTSTDLYSLSVVLFYVLVVGHPLVGRRELEFPVFDDRAESALFGKEPLFVFDPTDDRNHPVPDVHGSVLANWRLYPEPIRRLFTQAFTDGLVDPVNGRVRESVWRAALARLRDTIQCCPGCRKQSFWYPATRRRCWACDRELEEPLRLETEGQILVLNSDTVVYRHHLAGDYDFARPVARVSRHPRMPDRWGLTNESDQAWAILLPTGDRISAPPGRSVGLVPDTHIEMGSVATVLRR